MNKTFTYILLGAILMISGCANTTKQPPTNKPAQDTVANMQNNSNHNETDQQDSNIKSEDKTITIKLPYILPEDNGKNGKKIGCDDSIAFTELEIPYTKTPLKEAYIQLFAHNQNDHGLKDLKIDSASIQNGDATILLSGTYSLAGVCDDPRFENILKETALQFDSVTSVDIYINNILLDELLSSK